MISVSLQHFKICFVGASVNVKLCVKPLGTWLSARHGLNGGAFEGRAFARLSFRAIILLLEVSYLRKDILPSWLRLDPFVVRIVLLFGQVLYLPRSRRISVSSRGAQTLRLIGSSITHIAERRLLTPQPRRKIFLGPRKRRPILASGAVWQPEILVSVRNVQLSE